MGRLPSKKEEAYTTAYLDFEKANPTLFSYIEGFYKRNRIHSSINYLTPYELKIQEKINMSLQKRPLDIVLVLVLIPTPPFQNT